MHEKTFSSGKTYAIKHTGAKAQTIMFFRLMTGLGPILSEAKTVFSSLPGGDALAGVVADKTALFTALAEPIGKFLGQLDPAIGAALVADLCETTQIKGNNGVYADTIYDAHFGGNIGEAFSVAIWVITSEYGQLFGGLVPTDRTTALATGQAEPSVKK